MAKPLSTGRRQTKVPQTGTPRAGNMSNSKKNATFPK